MCNFNTAERKLQESIDQKTYKFIGTTFFKLKEAESWRGRCDRAVTTTKEEKEALNAMIWILLLIEHQKAGKEEVDYNACVAYIIKRCVRKSLTWDYKPENIKYIRQNMADYDEEEEAYVRSHFVNGTNEEFVSIIYELAKSVSPEQEKLFQVAKHYAHWVEFCAIKKSIYKESFRAIKADLKKELKRCEVDKYISKHLKELISYFSLARNVVRWQSCGYLVRCNILCHMLETAIFAWLMANEFNKMCSEGVAGARKFSTSQSFLCGLYHDISEVWTDDIPSPCKKIGKVSEGQDGMLRKVSETQEREALEKHFYSRLLPVTAEIFRTSIMLETVADEEFHQFIKNADYFSADYECYWQIAKGSRIKKFYDVITSSVEDVENSKTGIFGKRPPKAFEVLKEMLYNIEHNRFLEP